MHKDLLVYIVRHGETNENRLGIIQGQMDTQLNEAGRAQAKLTGRSLKDVKFIRAYSSDSSRAVDTAKEIVAYHPGCELVLDPRIRERNMGSLSGTKAPAKRPLPPGVETSKSMEARLLDFWENVIIPMLSPSATTLDDGESPNMKLDANLSPNPKINEEVHTPAVLLLSHGATISKLLTVFQRKYGYEVACEMRHGIYNTSISTLRMSIATIAPEPLPSDEDDAGESGKPMTSVTGVLITCGSIAHLIRKRDIVVENADLLGE
ncbi:unnamed protein product [Rhizoctonia solani]|uniref:Uncharacterized protein n=1 Tax=Rhizoctonia solani TaxID=456999 RepID=A0A8H3BHN5_9AGAM|nr:unnamed protein product [Rhizoctonia solani]CAE6458017.1 unnamed protein product [Rhizoctonia solani]